MTNSDKRTCLTGIFSSIGGVGRDLVSFLQF